MTISDTLRIVRFVVTIIRSIDKGVIADDVPGENDVTMTRNNARKWMR